MCRKIIIRLLAATCIGFVVLGNAANAAEISAHGSGLVPKPVRMEMSPGSFHLSSGCRILFESRSAGAKTTAEYLSGILRKVMTGSFPVQQAGAMDHDGILLTTAGAEASLGREGYVIEVTPTEVTAERSSEWMLQDLDYKVRQ